MSKSICCYGAALGLALLVSCAPGHPDELGRKQLEIDPNGPDIGIDAERLQLSTRVIANATVRQAEVDEGCAGNTTGRTLVRFDVKTPNFGPADLAFGSVTCVSTDPAPECESVNCFSNPECCCNGRSACTASDGDFGDAFEFACPHSHIHFKSFAEYRLLNSENEVAAIGHKQSFCLMDIEGAGDGPCAAFDRFTCGDQGIHAGCADVYSSALPCSYVDATGVPRGNYTLEVTIDPFNAIIESNEDNNVATAEVEIEVGPPPPPPPDSALFLVRDGIGTEDEADVYFADLKPSGFVAGSYTLDEWVGDFLAGHAQVSAFYRNKNELGFWREMICTETIDRAIGGCMVRNWDSPADFDAGTPNLGTVAMRLDQDGRTQFFAFNPDGVLSPSALLDDEGPKFLPRLCTNCHGGEYGGVAGDPDLGSIFREFEPSQLQRGPSTPADQAELQWFALNQAIRGANQAVRSEIEGAPFGVDAAKSNMASYVNAIYSSTDPPISRSVEDLAHLPASWQTGDTVEKREAKEQLWRQLVNPYCMTCHRTSAFNYENYATFSTMSLITDGRALLRRYIEVDPADPNRESLSFMPQSKLQWENLSLDAEALLSIDQWLQEQNRDPIADAGSDQVVTGAATVALSADGSSDPDGDPITFEWAVVAGPDVAFEPSDTARDVAFIAPDVSATTEMAITLTVRDSRLGESQDTVTVTVAPNSDHIVVEAGDTPIAIPDNTPTGITSTVAVGPDHLITEMSVAVTIDHTWRGDLRVELLGPGGFAKLLHNRTGSSADNLHATFLVPEAVGRSTTGDWKLEVSDHEGLDVGTLQTWSIDFGIAELPDNRPPVADAGADQVVTSGADVVISASGSSDPDGDALSFSWDQLGGPEVAFVPSSTARDVSFTAPEVSINADIVIRLRVRDPDGAEGQTDVVVSVVPAAGGRIEVVSTDTPIAIPDNNPTGITSVITVATDDEIAEMNVAVTIDHTWRGDLRVELRGPGLFAKVLHDRSGGDADDLHQVFAIGEVVGSRSGGNWELRVSDHAGADVGILQTWSVEFITGHGPDNRAPVADAGPDQTVQSGVSATLSAVMSTDPDGDALTYEWSQTSGPPVSIAAPNDRDTGFVAPDVATPTNVELRLSVRDVHGALDEDDITFTIIPSAGGGVLERTSTDTPLAIPDNDSTGVQSTISIAEAHTITAMSVTVNIDHTWIGDLRVVLTTPGGLSAVLHDRSGSSADDIHETYTITGAEGLSTAGDWSLRVSDHEGGDAGTLENWTLSLEH